MNARTVKRVLLCRPNYFDVEYIINPRMKPHAVDQPKAMMQWQKLVKALEALGVTVDIIEQLPDVPDMVYATDQGIVRGDQVLLANFRYTQRKKETIYYRQWFREHGFHLRSLSNVFAFEGGDALFFGEMLMIGTGFRANVASCEELAEKLNIDVFPLRLKDPAYYHLDMCLLPIDAETAFYYPETFSQNSRNLIKRLVKNLYELTTEEANGYAANSFVTDDTVIIQPGVSTFKKKLEELGKQVIEVDVSEFNKAGGGIHCLICPLEWS